MTKKKSARKPRSNKPRPKNGGVLGTYSKGNEFSLSVNISSSGGVDCSKLCTHHPLSTLLNALRDCYAVALERRYDRVQLNAKLQRHEAMPPWRVVGIALVELQDLIAKGNRIDWVRISTSGAVPEWDSNRCTPLFKSQLKAFLTYCSQHGIKVHFPVETWEKAEGYRSLVGDLICVRESIHDVEHFVSAPGAVSTSTGYGLKLLGRIAAARDLAKRRFAATGRRTIVCPAVTSSFLLRLARTAADKLRRREVAKKSKCGSCDACANDAIDIIYPAHA
jgi:hypothetical protein